MRTNLNCTLPLRPDRTRSGSVLLVVLVIVSLLTLAAYTYTQTMLTEYEAAVMYGSDIQAREAADSGVEYVATMLNNRTDPAFENTLHNPAMFSRPVVPSPHLRGTARFTVIAPVENPTSKVSSIRYGLMDESAKLNLNLIINQQLADADAETMLMKIPNMTAEIADAILDWIDPDDTVRPSGAESETYQMLNPPYSAKNGPIESVDELLMVKGVTPALLYGEDANRNGLLDPNENDGDASPPIDNHDGVLDHGLAAYLTAYARETNLRADGRPKIHLNNGLLTDLYDELQKEYGEDTAKFVIAIRLNGPKSTPPSSSSGKSSSSGSNSGSNSSSSSSGGSSSKSNGSSGGSSGSSSGSSRKTSSSSSSQGTSQQQKQAVQGLASAIASAALSPGGKVTRGGIDITNGGPYTISSIWVLFGSTATVSINNASTTLTSPWPSDPSSLQQVLPKLLDTLSITNDEFLEGRINVNQARREILLGIPGLTEELVDQIINAQQLDANGQPALDVVQRHNTTGWLYFEGLVDFPTMQSLDPYLTARGDVYRAQVFGFFDGGGPITRLEALIDGTKKPPRILFQRDLNSLGHGYSRMQLLPMVR